MSTVSELFASMKSWRQPPAGDNPFKLACRFDPGATATEISEAPPEAIESEELRALWSTTREAWLFEDTEYSQWGLHLLSPSESAARTATERAQRPDDLLVDDVVLGEFLGDSELLVYAPSADEDRRYLIALPLDPRDDWFPAGSSALEVLQRLLDADGEKYWEQAST